MSDIKSLQHLLNVVNDVQQKIEAARLCVLFQQTSNNSKSSEAHLKFDQLMNKFNTFSGEYRSELNQFHKYLLNNLDIIKLKELQKKNERERLEILKKLETISNCNTEIVDNLSDIDNNSSAVSVKYESKQDTITTPTPAPVTLPKVKPKQQNIRKNNLKNTHKKVQQKPSKKVQKSTTKKTQKTHRKSNTFSTKVNKVNNTVEEKDSYTKHMETPYEYNGSNWFFDGVQRSSTVIFMGNLPQEISKTQIQKFVIRRGYVQASQIIEIRIFGKYALIRLKNSVTHGELNRFITKINKENDAIYKQTQINKDKGKKVKNEIISWKKRIVLKFNKFNKFYKSEEDMYNDSRRNHQLFIRNFDILNERCHKELTCELLKYGDLYNDVVIKVDRFGDPFCIVSFKYMNEAIYCCNSKIKFNGRMLEIRYAKQ